MKKTNSGFDFYIITRTFSAVMDEAFTVALPILMASLGYSIFEYGKVSFYFGLGTVLGFVFAPYLTFKLPSQKVAILSDTATSILMFFIGIYLFKTKALTSIFSINIIGFLIAFFYSVWFAASETIVSTVKTKNNDLLAQRWVVFANHMGSLVGPVIGGLISSLSNMAVLCIANAISFIFQIFGLKNLNNEVPQKWDNNDKFLDHIGEGISSIKRSSVMAFFISLSLIYKFLIGGIGFIIFKLKSFGDFSVLAGAIMSIFGIGAILAILFPQKIDVYLLAKEYKKSMILCTFSIIMALAIIKFFDYIYYLPKQVLILFFIFLAGFYSARHQILFRTIRQKTEVPETMPTQIAVAGFLARLVAPFAGFFFPWIISSSSNNLFIFIFIVIVLIILLLTIKLQNNYEFFIKQ